MADQTAQPDTPPRASEIHSEAMRELAAAIHDLAGAIRESASFAGEIEWVPCDEASATDSNGDDGNDAGVGRLRDHGDQDSGPAPEGSASDSPSTDSDGGAEEGSGVEDGTRAGLQIVPIQDRGDGEGDRTRPEPGSLCQPGGCRCEEASEGIGRHARHDPVVMLVDETQCCRAVQTGAR